jgi:hypothetical protein
MNEQCAKHEVWDAFDILAFHVTDEHVDGDRVETLVVDEANKRCSHCGRTERATPDDVKDLNLWMKGT